MQLKELTAYLDDYLAIAEVPDFKEACNGLQVEGRAEVKCVAVAVDACLATIEGALEGGADLMIVHHGLTWGRTVPVTGAYYRRLAALIKHDLPLYACHLPLDAHPEVGNNHVLARQLGLKVDGLFAEYEGVPLGVLANTEMPCEVFLERVQAVLGVKPKLMPCGPETVRRVGILTGGGGGRIEQAARAGCDTYLTGEGAHHTYFEAEERGLNVLYAGHYATETVGVKALAGHLERQFGLETFFLDHPTGL